MTKSMEVEIKSAYTLRGTLTIPEEERNVHPAVLIIPGSGKSDRDGNMEKMNMNLYKDLAEYFDRKGFVTLRYDKRGTHQSEGDYYAAGVYDLIDDAAECVRYLQSHPKVDKEKILIAGHSEGALIAPAVHKKTPVSGLILLAGAAEPSKDLLSIQSEMAFQEIEKMKGWKGALFRLLKVAEKGRKQNAATIQKIVESDQDVMRIRGAKINAKWIREQFKYNVCDYLEEVTCPVLAITGDKDIQVPPEHAKKIADLVQGPAVWHIIPDMNHIFRKMSGNHTMLGLLKEYKRQVEEPIDKRLFEHMDEWLEKIDESLIR
ncbi:alpha/beta hydrolase [Compostibacillus humi]|uniref:Alpha/beta hydrolase n=1 Tax=Compostibacillus humi TaxID=1245525 RepID=A0A8J2TP99_9BACI|nr:alpha/beta hydrolase [Compostibacillus humi]GFZ85031.1 alpha/beta hydrolase [Compostibacillus humi]